MKEPKTAFGAFLREERRKRNMTQMEFADFVKACRRKHNISQKELAERIGVSFYSIRGIENSTGFLTPKRQEALIDFLLSFCN